MRRRSTLTSNALYWNDDQDVSSPDAGEIIASLWGEQVEAYDSLPRRRRRRSGDLTFSPSKVDACARELFYDATGAPADDEPEIPWKVRRARNGDAYHVETQRHHSQMHEKLRREGRDDVVNFVVLATEVDGYKQFTVTQANGTKRIVRIKGRCDAIVRYVGKTIPGVIEHDEVVLVDLKTKSKLSGVSGVKRRGLPSYTLAQMVAYSLLRFETKDGQVFDHIGKAILHFESLEKMRESETESKDVHPMCVIVDEDDQRRLLARLASIVEAVEEGTLPPPETDKCNFCRFKTKCAADNEEAV